jgi:hypothetical protein
VALIAALGRPGLAAAADTDAVPRYLGIRILGLEAKYLNSRGHEIRLEGRPSNVTLDSLLFAFGLRIFFP